jgi:hypothetical protein
MDLLGHPYDLWLKEVRRRWMASAILSVLIMDSYKDCGNSDTWFHLRDRERDLLDCGPNGHYVRDAAAGVVHR